MNRKKELLELRFFFKQNGLEYSHLEEKLSYGKGTLRSSIARGGTDTLLLKLKELKSKLFPDAANAAATQDEIVKEPIPTYGNKSFNSEYIELQAKLIDKQEELLKLKEENTQLVKENCELKAELVKYKSGNVETPIYTSLIESKKRIAAS